MSADGPERAAFGSDRVRTEISGNIGECTRLDADPLDEFEFGPGDRFVRWHPWGNERADEDVWSVTSTSWKFRVTWIRDRDDFPTQHDHRQYTLLSKETFESVQVTEEELLRGDWNHASNVEGVDQDE